MEIIPIIEGILAAIGIATVAFRMIAPLTKNKKDDHVLKYLELFLSKVSLNKAEGEVKIKVRQ